MAKREIKPIGKYIVLRTIVEEVRTESGLLLSANDAAEMRYRYGTVYKVGTDVTVINEGDFVFYDKSGSFTMLIDNETFTVILERDVVVVA